MTELEIERETMVIVLRNADGQILMQHRTDDAPVWPGKWTRRPEAASKPARSRCGPRIENSTRSTASRSTTPRHDVPVMRPCRVAWRWGALVPAAQNRMAGAVEWVFGVQDAELVQEPGWHRLSPCPPTGCAA
jgi:hypothetical protein